MSNELHFERISARKYYGKHAVGSVVLCNGHVQFHSDVKDVNAFIKELKEKGLWKENQK